MRKINVGGVIIIICNLNVGGVITSGMAIYDTMNYISSPVHTLAMGSAMSMGSFLLAGGTQLLKIYC